jgi:hypothetical protein
VSFVRRLITFLTRDGGNDAAGGEMISTGASGFAAGAAAGAPQEVQNLAARSNDVPHFVQKRALMDVLGRKGWKETNKKKPSEMLQTAFETLA